jgi:hypothetical protein
MKSAKQYNEMTQKAAYQIMRAMAVFNNEPEHIRHQAEQIIMQRVQLMRSGSQEIIDGDHLVREFVEPTPEPEPQPPENPEADQPAP